MFPLTLSGDFDALTLSGDFDGDKGSPCGMKTFVTFIHSSLFSPRVNVFVFFCFCSLSNMACIPKSGNKVLCYAIPTNDTVYVAIVTVRNFREDAHVFKWTMDGETPVMEHCKYIAATEGVCGFAIGYSKCPVVVWQETYGRIMVTHLEERARCRRRNVRFQEEDTFCVNNLTAEKDIRDEFKFIVNYFDGPCDFPGRVFFDLVKFKPSSNEEVLGECTIGDWVILHTEENYYISKA